MPNCDACARHWTPTSLRPEGSCPTCGQVLELVKPLGPGPLASAEPPPRDAADPPPQDEPAGPEAPWHFKVLLVALAIYLAWRGIQGLGWLAGHL